MGMRSPGVPPPPVLMSKNHRAAIEAQIKASAKQAKTTFSAQLFYGDDEPKTHWAHILLYRVLYRLGLLRDR